MRVQDGEVVLALRVALLGGEAQPFRGFRVIGGCATAFEIHFSQVTGGQRVILIGGPAEPHHGLRVIFSNAVTGQVNHAQLQLRVHVPREGLLP